MKLGLSDNEMVCTSHRLIKNIGGTAISDDFTLGDSDC